MLHHQYPYAFYPFTDKHCPFLCLSSCVTHTNTHTSLVWCTSWLSFACGIHMTRWCLMATDRRRIGMYCTCCCTFCLFLLDYSCFIFPLHMKATIVSWPRNFLSFPTCPVGKLLAIFVVIGPQPSSSSRSEIWAGSSTGSSRGPGTAAQSSPTTTGRFRTIFRYICTPPAVTRPSSCFSVFLSSRRMESAPSFNKSSFHHSFQPPGSRGSIASRGGATFSCFIPEGTNLDRAMYWSVTLSKGPYGKYIAISHETQGTIFQEASDHSKYGGKAM